MEDERETEGRLPALILLYFSLFQTKAFHINTIRVDFPFMLDFISFEAEFLSEFSPFFIQSKGHFVFRDDIFIRRFIVFSLQWTFVESVGLKVPQINSYIIRVSVREVLNLYTKNGKLFF